MSNDIRTVTVRTPVNIALIKYCQWIEIIYNFLNYNFILQGANAMKS